MSARILVIDCATPSLSVALFEGEDCIAATHRELGRGHAEALLPTIAALPDGGRCDHILVDVGPGSFTGVRVGLAAATALAFAWQVPVAGYGCLDLVAAMARARLRPSGPFAVVMVGGHGELFWARCPAADDADRRAPIAVRSTPIDALAAMLDVPLIVGSGAHALVEAGMRAEAHPLLPDARDLFLLPAEQRMRAARPEYGRGADARPMPVAVPAEGR
jgi:tRNA threonylcarbamoyl adenosine modification protein YeaZ